MKIRAFEIIRWGIGVAILSPFAMPFLLPSPKFVPSDKQILPPNEARTFVVSGLNGHAIKELHREEDPLSPFALGYTGGLFGGTQNVDELEYARGLSDDLSLFIDKQVSIERQTAALQHKKVVDSLEWQLLFARITTALAGGALLFLTKGTKQEGLL